MRRIAGFFVLFVLVLLVAFIGYRVYTANGNTGLENRTKTLIRAYLNGDLTAHPGAYEDMATERFMADIEKLREAEKQAGGQVERTFIRFVRKPTVTVIFPPDGEPTWKRLTAVVVYRVAGSTLMGQVDVDFVKVGETWKADRILGAKPLAVSRDGRWERMGER